MRIPASFPNLTTNFWVKRNNRVDRICPVMIVRASSCATGNIIPLLLSPNTANLQRIVCNVHEPLLLRLLVCREKNVAHNSNDCPYPDHINSQALKKACRDSEKKLAQVYVRHEQLNKKARSCVLIFIERHTLNKTEELSKLLKDTVGWLQIAQEKPYFYIFHYGQPEFSVNTNNAIKSLNKKIKETIDGYSQDEDSCIGVSVIRGSESLTIITNSGKFSFTAA